MTNISVVLIYYFTLSIITYFVYGNDKYRASRRKERIPEITLHLFDFLGGWPGGFFAQHLKKHKNKKWQFQVIFWIIVLIHVSFWVYFIFWYAGFNEYAPTDFTLEEL